MIRLAAQESGRIAFALSLVCAMASVAWTWRLHSAMRASGRGPPVPELHGSDHVAAAWANGPVALARWPAPAGPVDAGLFTPPATGPATETASAGPVIPREAPPPAGIELVAVRRAPFRVQLAGYVGAPGNYLVAFDSAGTSLPILARAGDRLPEVGLVLRDFGVGVVNLDQESGPPANDLVARAVLFDERTGTDVVLDDRGPTPGDVPLAVLKGEDPAAPVRELREGETVAWGALSCRVERIQIEPPQGDRLHLAERAPRTGEDGPATETAGHRRVRGTVPSTAGGRAGAGRHALRLPLS